jgi:acylphosphatase
MVGVVERKHVFVVGLVQGVFFRETCRRTALQAGVSGWVRNLRDGRVEAVFEGGPDAVERMVRWAGQGPRGAAVTSIDVLEEPAEGLMGFVIA